MNTGLLSIWIQEPILETSLTVLGTPEWRGKCREETKGKISLELWQCWS